MKRVQKAKERGRLAPICVIGAIALAGCGCPPSDELAGDPLDRAEAILAKSARFELMTPEPYDVNPELSRLCVGVSREMKASTAERNGPHTFTTITVSMNKPAAKAFRSKSRPFPVGSVIIKRKDASPLWRSNEQPHDAVGGMVKKSPGYDPANGDWEYFYLETPAPRLNTDANPGFLPNDPRFPQRVAGKLANCIDCHSNASDRDYVFGSWANAKRKNR